MAPNQDKPADPTAQMPGAPADTGVQTPPVGAPTPVTDPSVPAEPVVPPTSEPQPVSNPFAPAPEAPAAGETPVETPADQGVPAPAQPQDNSGQNVG